MTRIALIGVPGSGKSVTAATLKTAIAKADIDGCDCMTPIEIIDNYVPEVEEETGLALGYAASYVGNLELALARARRERKNTAKTTITCGTIIETATYLTIDGIAQMNLEDEFEKADTMKRLEAAMKTLACLYVDTFHYEHVFYLPALALPEDIDQEKTRLLDRNLQTAFQAFNLVPVTPLMAEGDTPLKVIQHRVEKALEQILGVPVEG